MFRINDFVWFKEIIVHHTGLFKTLTVFDGETTTFEMAKLLSVRLVDRRINYTFLSIKIEIKNFQQMLFV